MIWEELATTFLLEDLIVGLESLIMFMVYERNGLLLFAVLCSIIESWLTRLKENFLGVYYIFIILIDANFS